MRSSTQTWDPQPPTRAVTELRGAQQAAQGALQFSCFAPFVRPALINGAAGVVAFTASSRCASRQV
jgi:hypothetical protein